MSNGSYKVLLTNPCSFEGGCGDPITRDSISEAYVIVPDEGGVYVVYLAGTYVGTGESLEDVETIIQEDGARSESVLIENPSGGYKVYTHKRKNPKKKSSKKKTAKRKSTRKGQPRKTARRAYEPKKKATKKKATKKKATKKKATKKLTKVQKERKRKAAARKAAATRKRNAAAAKRKKAAKKKPAKRKVTKKKVTKKRSTRKGQTRKTARKAYDKETPSQAKTRINAALKALMGKK